MNPANVTSQVNGGFSRTRIMVQWGMSLWGSEDCFLYKLRSSTQESGEQWADSSKGFMIYDISY